MRSLTATKQPNEPKFLPDKHIEEHADVLLAQYAQQSGEPLAPGIPVDDIAEVFLGLTVEMMDLQTLFGDADVNGAIWIPQKKIGIDQSLDTRANKRKEGRYHYTLAHEIGHWWLHRQLYTPDTSQGLLHAGASAAQPTYVCRDGSRAPVEVQANKFAAYLLMPAKLVLTSWREIHGLDAITLDALRPRQQNIIAAEVLHRGGLAMDPKTVDNAMLEHVARPVAERFKVSAEAMMYRLEALGLLLRKSEPMLF